MAALTRSSAWLSVPATRRDAQHAEFAVPVPAGGEAVLGYTVRYRWPEGMKP